MSELDDLVSTLKALGARDLGARIAKVAAPLLHAALLETLEAGETPEGLAWANKKRGGRAYVHAASHLSEAKATGDIVRVTLTGPEVFGHFGARGMPKRQMLPDAGGQIPQSVTDALTQAAKTVIAEASK